VSNTKARSPLELFEEGITILKSIIAETQTGIMLSEMRGNKTQSQRLKLELSHYESKLRSAKRALPTVRFTMELAALETSAVNRSNALGGGRPKTSGHIVEKAQKRFNELRHDSPHLLKKALVATIIKEGLAPQEMSVTLYKKIKDTSGPRRSGKSRQSQKRRFME
jgi:hypothetical protein